MPNVAKGSVRLVFEGSEMHQFTPGSTTALDRNGTPVHFGSTFEINKHGKKLNPVELYGRAKLAICHYVKMIKKEVIAKAKVDVVV